MKRFVLTAAAALLASTFLVDTTMAANLKGKVNGGRQLERSPAVVYLAGVDGPFKAPAKNPVMDQKNMTFIPHVLPVQTGTTVDFLNNDEVRHNIFSPDHEKYNLGTWPQGEVKEYTFKKQGVYTQLCNVHPEMEAFVVALDTPYFTLTGEDGSFELKDIPPGTYTIKAWHEKLRFESAKITAVESGGESIVIERRQRR